VNTVTPVKIRQPVPGELSVEWDDGHRGRHTLKSLRDNCPCASCKEERERSPRPLLPVLVPGKYELKAIEPVGSYALQVSWGDGHKTGIYTFEYLRYLCECDMCSQTTRQQRVR